MKHRRLMRLTCAACLLLCAGSFAYHAAAATMLDLSAGGRRVEPSAPRPCPLLYGKRLITFAGYELDATFTPGGEFYCFEINKSGVKRQ